MLYGKFIAKEEGARSTQIDYSLSPCNKALILATMSDSSSKADKTHYTPFTKPTLQSSVPSSYFELRVTKAGDFETDYVDSVYALRVKGYRCKVARPSTVYVVAVRSLDDAGTGASKERIHCGLLLENTFRITGSSSDMEFPYVLIHAMPVAGTTEIRIRFLRSHEDAFRHIEQMGFMKSDRGWKRAKTGGWRSTIACSKAVSTAKKEVGRRFVIQGSQPEVNLRNRTVELNPDITNCTLCAIRFYCTLEETDVEDEALQVLDQILPQLGMNAAMTAAYKRMVPTSHA